MPATPLHIVNIMLSAGQGGIEQAFIDYCEGLTARGHRVTPITVPGSKVDFQLKLLGLSPMHLSNWGEWDILAKWILKRILGKLRPDVVIVQTNRAFALAEKAVTGICPLVAVTHNYNKRTSHYVKADAVFATTHDLMHHVTSQGVSENHIFHVPNMVRVEALPVRQTHYNTPVIGAMGRLVQKKGFDVYIDALQLLKQQGLRFKAVLGGTGPDRKDLRKRAVDAGLGDILTFTNWVEDKKKFYTGLDVFCLPSHHEPFGIVLLEAFSYGVPVVSTDSEGPHDIITPNFDAILVRKGSALELANGLAQMIRNPEQAAKLAANGFVKAKTQYSIESVSAKIETALQQVLERWKGK